MLIGMNLGFVNHYSHPVFKDARLQAKSLNDTLSIVYKNIDNHYPLGNYNDNRIVSSHKGGIIFDRSKPLIAESNISVGHSFNPQWLEKVKQFDIIRLLDFQNINNSNLSEIDDLPDVNDPQEINLSLEYIVELQALTGKAVWVHIPHKASDELILHMGYMLKDIPDIYVEYSNELWNTNFEQTEWFQEWSGTKIGTSEWLEALGNRIEHTINLFKFACYNAKRVVASQSTVPFYMRELLKTVRHYDVFSCGGYINVPMVSNYSVMKSNCIYYIDNVLIPRLEEYRNLSYKPLILYEGGLHITGSDWEAISNFVKSKDGLMMLDYLLSKLELVVDGYIHYKLHQKHDNTGAWGALEYTDQSNSPTLQLIKNYDRK